MIKRRVWPAILSLAAIILELLPTGAVLNFFAPPGMEGFRETFSYFNFIMLWGYASFGPVLTAVATCALFVLALVYLFSGKCKTAVGAVSAIAFVCSIMPLTGGLRYFSVTGAAISVVLAAATVLAFVIKDRKSTAVTSSVA